MITKLSIFSAVFTLLMIASFSLKVAAQEGGDKAIIEGRSDLMRGIRDTFRPLRAMLMAGAFEVIVIKSGELHNLAQKITTVFSKKALSNESRAKKEIWNDWEGFTKKAKEFTDEVAGLQKTAKASNAKKTEGHVKGVLMACKSCHRSFRKPKPKAEDEYQ